VTFTEMMSWAARGFDGLGVVVLVIGLVWSLVLAARVWRRSGEGRQGYHALRESFGGVLLLAVEILVSADLIRTVAVAPTLENVAGLGLVVVVRTLLSFSLQIEMEGVVPWRRAQAGDSGGLGQAAARANQSPEPPPA
jgi:uncharacterized membrane protein